MKKFFLLSLALLSLSLLVVLLGSSRESDARVRFRNPDYYAWKSGGGKVSATQFWSGFKTDGHRKEIFIGQTRSELQKKLSWLIPMPANDDGMNRLIASRRLPPARFAWMEGSRWMLEFDAEDRCTDLSLAKR